jgi:hypothetical protein
MDITFRSIMQMQIRRETMRIVEKGKAQEDLERMESIADARTMALLVKADGMGSQENTVLERIEVENTVPRTMANTADGIITDTAVVKADGMDSQENISQEITGMAKDDRVDTSRETTGIPSVVDIILIRTRMMRMERRYFVLPSQKTRIVIKKQIRTSSRLLSV